MSYDPLSRQCAGFTHTGVYLPLSVHKSKQIRKPISESNEKCRINEMLEKSQKNKKKILIKKKNKIKNRKSETKTKKYGWRNEINSRPTVNSYLKIY